MSVLAYQEVARRIEELTRCIYELDPFAGCGDEALTLGLLLEAGERARGQRRPRSPLARAPAPAAALAPAPTTYAEIVKGFGSRSSSVGSRHHSAQRAPYELARPPTPPHEPYLSDAVPCPISEVAPEHSAPLSEAVQEASDSDAYTHDPLVRQAPDLEDNDRFDLTIEPQRSPEVYILESESETCVQSAELAPSYTELRPPEYHDRSLSPATRLRSQDLSYAEILALGLRKQAKAQNIIALPKPQVAQVEMVKEIIVEVEKVPSVIHHEPRVQSTDSLRFKTDRPERPFQRSRSRDMPRQRRAPEKRPTKTHDLQSIKKKKTSKKVIEVVDFDDTAETQVQETFNTSTVSSSLIKKEEPKLEKVTKIQHSATVIENITDDAKSSTPKLEGEHKKSKKKNKHKKIKETDDEIEKALKEIEESDRHKKRKTKDNRDKSKEIFKESSEVAEKVLESKPTEIKESSHKPKKKKNSKDVRTDKATQGKTISPSDVQQNTEQNIVQDIVYQEPKQDTVSEIIPEQLHSRDLLATKTLEILNEDGTFNKSNDNDASDSSLLPMVKNFEYIKEDASKTMSQSILETTNTFIQSEISTEAVTSAIVTTLKESNITELSVSLKDQSAELETELPSKQKKKKKIKKQGKTAADETVTLPETEVVEMPKPNELKPSELTRSEKSLDKDKPEDYVHVHSKKKKGSKEPKTTEYDTLIHEKPTIYQGLPIDEILEDKKSSVGLDSVQFTEVKGHKKKSKNKKSKNVDDEIEKALKSIENITKRKSKEKVLEPKDEQKEIEVEHIELEATSSQKESKAESCEEVIDYAHKVHTNLVTMDWNTLMAEEESILESELSPINQPTSEIDTNNTNIQVASEVTILPEITDLSNVSDKNDDFIDCKQAIDSSEVVKDVTTDSEEQNNNNKLLTATPSTDNSFNIVEEITSYKPMMENIETRTIYLITHEEKKLPPIRTVKIFNSKSNSLETDTAVDIVHDESLREPTGSPENIVEKERNILDTDKGISENTEILQLDVESNINNSTDVPIVTTLSNDVHNIKSEDAIETEFEMSLLDPTNTKNDQNYTENPNDENDGVISLETIRHNIVNLSPNVEEFSESILEHAIFGSVQDRKRSAPRVHTIPYQELIEDIKTYSLSLDVDEMEYNYHQLMEENNGTTNIKDTSADQTQELREQRNEVVQSNVVKDHNKEKEIHNKFEPIPTTYLEIIIGPHEINTDNLKNTIELTEGTSHLGKDEKPIDTTEITKQVVNIENKENTRPDISLNTLQNEIPRFNYAEITESEKLFAINTSCPTNSKKEIQTPFEENSQIPISQNTVIIEDKPLRKFENDMSNNEKDNQIVIQQTIFEPYQKSYFTYHDISDAEKNYPCLTELHPKQQTLPTLDVTTVTLAKLDENKVEVNVSYKYEDVCAPIGTLEQESYPLKVLLSEVPKYDLHEIKRAEILFVSTIIQSNEKENESEVTLETKINVQSTPKDISSPLKFEKTVAITTDVTDHNDKNKIDENVIHDKIELQNYQHIYDAENKYATYLSNTEVKNMASESSTDKIPTKIAIGSLTYDENNMKPVHDGKIANDPMDTESTFHSEIATFEPMNYNYLDLKDAEIRLGHISTKNVLIISEKAVEIIKNQSITNADDKYLHSSENVSQSNNSDLDSEVDTRNTNDNVTNYKMIFSETNIAAKVCDQATDITQETKTICTPVSAMFSDTEVIKSNELKVVKHEEISGEDYTDSAPVEIHDTIVTKNNPADFRESESTSSNTLIAVSITGGNDILDNVSTTKSEDKITQSLFNENITSSEKHDLCLDINVKDSRNRPSDGEILLSQTNLVGKTGTEKADMPQEQEIVSSLIPIVFGDVTEIAKLSLERNANSKDLEKDKNQNQFATDSVHLQADDNIVTEDVVDDFVVVEDIKDIEMPQFENVPDKSKNENLNISQNLTEELDFEHSFEVIDVEKDISSEINNSTKELIENIPKDEIQSPAVYNIETAPFEENSEITTSTAVVPLKTEKMINLDRMESEFQKSQDMPKTISAEVLKADIFPSSYDKKLNVDDTHGTPNNATSTDSYINLDTEDITDDLISNQSILPKKITDTRLEKSPIHSLHDLLPEIDSIPEFKPSFSNTVLNSKLSADAPEFTPSYMYQTSDNSVPKCAMVDTKHLLLSDSKEMDHPDITPVTYSSVLTTKKEKPVSDSGSNTDDGRKHDKTHDVIELNEASVDTKAKRNKKKKKKEEKIEIIETTQTLREVDPPILSVSVSHEHIPQTGTECPDNVWVRDDGKSYAKVLAAGLTYSEHKESLATNVKDSEVKTSSDFTNIENERKEVESIEILEESDNYEVVGSWAKIVASNRPSPERTPKPTIHTADAAHITKAPIILVDDSDSDHHKPEIEVDADGFIRVDRNRRSRSRSRDNRSASMSKTESKISSREKSENRFIALKSTLKPDDGDSIHSSHSDEEKVKERKDEDVKEQSKRGRKGRTSKSKDKEVKQKTVPFAPSTSDEEKQPIKKDKKKRSSKSKDKSINQPTETVESKQTLQEIKETQPVVQEQDASIQLSSETEMEQKRKTKKKKKEKKVVMSTDTPSPLENTSSEQESVKSSTSTCSAKCPETPISTPESLETPIKDRVYSEAQYWKIDPSSIDDFSNLSETLTVELDDHSKNKYESLIIEQQQVLQNNDLKNKNNTVTDNLYKVLTEGESETSTVPKESAIIAQRISDEQSLEHKMADLQREIEEMLLPENDASVTSDETPRELADTQTSLDDQHDETFENISPCLASPEPEDIPQSNTCVLEESSSILNVSGNEEETRTYLDTNSEVSKVSPSMDDSIDDSPCNIQKLDCAHIRGVDFSTDNISSNTITNNLINIKLDTFWISKAATDDAEKILIEQNVSNLETPEYSKQETQKCDTLTETTILIDNDIKDTKKTIDYEPFWPEKHLYHDAECNYFLFLAKKPEERVITNTEIEITDKKDKDKDPGGGSGHSSEMEEPRESSGSPFDSNYISMDLPGGICSWKDQSSYLSLETPCDSLTVELSEDTPRVGIDIPEDKLTNPFLEPVASPLPEQEPSPEEAGNRMTAKVNKLQSYSTLFRYLFYVWHDFVMNFLITLSRITVVNRRLQNSPLVL